MRYSYSFLQVFEKKCQHCVCLSEQTFKQLCHALPVTSAVPAVNKDKVFTPKVKVGFLAFLALAQFFIKNKLVAIVSTCSIASALNKPHSLHVGGAGRLESECNTRGGHISWGMCPLKYRM